MQGPWNVEDYRQLRQRVGPEMYDAIYEIVRVAKLLSVKTSPDEKAAVLRQQADNLIGKIDPLGTIWTEMLGTGDVTNL